MKAEAKLTTIGDEAILKRPMLALLSSYKCPGRIIMDTYDLFQGFRDKGITVISGFHSPMEKECLRILLGSTNYIVWCLARGMIKRLPEEIRKPVADGQLLIYTSFPDNIRRPTANTAIVRNRRIAEMADQVIVSHAASGGKTEQLSREILSNGKPLYTFDDPANDNLLKLGAKPVDEIFE